MSRIDESIQAKREKREQLIAEGVVPHPYSFAKQHTIAQALALENTVVTTAGRIMSIRAHGSVTFLDLQDTTGNMQVMIRKSAIPEATYKQLQTLVDRGDFYGVTGEVTRTKTNEITIAATEVTFLGKTLRPLPTQWNAAEDKEARFRQRYLDMLVNPETKRVLDIRWQTEKEIRRYLQDRFDFVEVETPILQTLYGGTNAKPFHTHMNALDSDFYLRIAPELYLKRLIVGGYERIFEIARNFRNEGIDQTHQPEFTMIEWYHAYADYQTMMDVAEGLLRHLVQTVRGQSTLTIGETVVDVGPAWPRITMTEAIKRHLQLDFDAQTDDELQALMQKHKMELIGEFTRGKALFSIFDKLVAPLLIEPTWIIDYPRDVSPLAKQHRLHPELAERFECYIGGKELCDGWSEITDPIDQRAIFENEQKRMRSGDSEAHPLDEDFLEAMEHGMPPLGGIGMGIDRLVMFLTNTWSIREVIAFPTLRPKTPQKIVDEGATKEEQSKVSISTGKTTTPASEATSLPSRQQSEDLLKTHVKNPALLRHCYMVANALEAYAQQLGEDAELWYQAGLLHDLDWEAYSTEHPFKAVNELLTEYPEALKQAILAHGPQITGKQPETPIERYLFACDELSGLMHAVSILRPNGFADMQVKSVKKKLKDKGFAANVSREDIQHGSELIATPLEDHIAFLITVFTNQPSE